MKVAFDLSGRRIVITGGAGGIGAASAAVCARLGAEVILIDVVGSQRVVEAIRSDGGRASSYVADAANGSDMERLSAVIGAADGSCSTPRSVRGMTIGSPPNGPQASTASWP
jgi:NAD(P)-dependent dehydrogenase (short-subunit alcohol dehydrogenase family)